LIAILFSPIWTPFYLLSLIGYMFLTVGDKIVIMLEDVLEWILGKVVPQLKDR